MAERRVPGGVPPYGGNSQNGPLEDGNEHSFAQDGIPGLPDDIRLDMFLNTGKTYWLKEPSPRRSAPSDRDLDTYMWLMRAGFGDLVLPYIAAAYAQGAQAGSPSGRHTPRNGAGGYAGIPADAPMTSSSPQPTNYGGGSGWPDDQAPSRTAAYPQHPRGTGRSFPGDAYSTGMPTVAGPYANVPGYRPFAADGLSRSDLGANARSGADLDTYDWQAEGGQAEQNTILPNSRGTEGRTYLASAAGPDDRAASANASPIPDRRSDNIGPSYYNELGEFTLPETQWKNGNGPVYTSGPPTAEFDNPGAVFDDIESAARYVHEIINPVSIKQNMEYQWKYYRDGKTGKVGFMDPAASRPEGGRGLVFRDISNGRQMPFQKEIGLGHTHGDWAKWDPKRGKRVRTDRRTAEGRSDYFSLGKESDLNTMENGPSDLIYTLGTPSGKLWLWSKSGGSKQLK